MGQFRHSAAFRLSLICGGLVAASVILLSIAFYLGTVGVMEREADDKITAISQRLAPYPSGRTAGQSAGHNAPGAPTPDAAALARIAGRIERALSDGIDSDTEIYLLTDAQGVRLAGNIALPDRRAPLNCLFDRTVLRDAAVSSPPAAPASSTRTPPPAPTPVPVRLLLRTLPDGALLAVGRDMRDLHQIRTLIWRAIEIGGLLALLLSIGGTLFFRSRIERRILAIRLATQDIETGNLSRRVAVSGADEFARLGHDLNRMLDRIEQLMDGVRHMSNTIAHNLRTPLGRIRGHLDLALRAAQLRTADAPQKMAGAGHDAIEEINRLSALLDRLLQTAEAESGFGRQPFAAVALADVATDMVELYDAAAEAQGVAMTVALQAAATVCINGDRQLLASALADLLDNALKYTAAYKNGSPDDDRGSDGIDRATRERPCARPATITVRVTQQGGDAVMTVCDNGPGIPAAERANVLQRFYRLDHRVQGNGIGLSSVAAIVALHRGALVLEDALPGLCVRMTFPLRS